MLSGPQNLSQPFSGTVMGKLDDYLFEHGHLPRATLQCGKRSRLRVEVWPGCLAVAFWGRYWSRTFYVPRSTTIILLRWLIPLVKLMDQEVDHDERMHQAYLFEQRILKEKRRFKRQ